MRAEPLSHKEWMKANRRRTGRILSRITRDIIANLPKSAPYRKRK